jgi:hypothetical protein
MKRVIELLSSFPTVVFTAVLAFCLVWWFISLVVSGADGTGETDVDGDVDFDGDFGSGGHPGGHSVGGPVGHVGHVGHVGNGPVGHSGPTVGAHASGASHVDHSGHLGHGPGHGAAHGGAHRGGHQGRSVSARLAKSFRLGEVPLSLGFTVLSFGAWAISGVLQLAFEGFTNSHRIAHAVVVLVSIAILLISAACGFALLGYFAKISAPLFVTTTAPLRNEALGGTCRIRTTHVSGTLGEAEVLTGVAKGQIVRVRTDSGDFVRGDIAQLVDYDESTSAFTIVELDPVLRNP